MARVQGPPILMQLKSARTAQEQVVALRALKNELVGHVQKKESWVRQGALDPIVRVLSAARSQQLFSQSQGKDVSSRGTGTPQLNEQDQVRLQALQLLSSFANGGPRFMRPLYESGAINAMLENLSPAANPPQISLAALRGLLNLADAAALSLPGSGFDVDAFAEMVFRPEVIGFLADMIAANPATPTARDQLHMACGLLARLCREERHQFALTNSTVPDALATRLASFVVAEGQVIPASADFLRDGGGDAALLDFIPEPAPRGVKLALVLEAAAAVAGDSRYGASRLVYSPAMLAVFPSNPDFVAGRDGFWQGPLNALETAGLMGKPRDRHAARAHAASAMDFLLPAVPTTQRQPPRTSGSSTGPFPPLGASSSSGLREGRDGGSAANGRGSSSSGKHRSDNGVSGSRAAEAHAPADSSDPSEDSEGDETESALIPWLITLMRSRAGLERLMAASVLTSLFKAGFANKTREVTLAPLVVPLLLQLVNDCESDWAREASFVDEETATLWKMREVMPAVLARLITDSEILQQAAFGCDAVKILRNLIKEAYEPTPDSALTEPWSANPGAAAENDGGLGPKGYVPIMAHNLRVRESSLKAIGALASFKDEYRRSLVDQEVMCYIVESLNPTPSKPRTAKERGKGEKATEGAADANAETRYGVNPGPVLIAACHAVRMFSRSVSILRTSLVDFGVAMPIFKLLRYHDLEIQIAATGAICNLVTEVSPMREQITEAGVMKILCEHAHSLNAALRLNALWALKHFVVAVGNDVKRASLETLGSGWLVQLIRDDPEDEALYSLRSSKGDKSSAPAQLASHMSDAMDEDVEMDQFEDQQGKQSWRAAARLSPYVASSTNMALYEGLKHSPTARDATVKLLALREAELNPVRRARSDDLAIQEQGLDFMRNLIGGPGPSGPGGPGHGGANGSNDTTEMIDYLFTTLDPTRLFEILASKLRAKVVPPFGSGGSRRLGGGSGGNGNNGNGNGSAAGASGGISTAAVRERRKLYPQAKIIEAVVFILVHVAASVPQHRQLVMAQTELLRQLKSHFSSRDKEVRVALCLLVFNLTCQDDAGDEHLCAQRAAQLRNLGFEERLAHLEQSDPELDVRERARLALYQMKHCAAY